MPPLFWTVCDQAGEQHGSEHTTKQAAMDHARQLANENYGRRFDVKNVDGTVTYSIKKPFNAWT